MKSVFATFLSITTLAVGAFAAEPHVIRSHCSVELKGDMAHPDQLSGVTFWRDMMVVCPDEGVEFNLLKCAHRGYELTATVPLLDDSDDEIDMEGATSDSEYVYIVGSHSTRRKTVEDKGTYERNRKRLSRVTPHRESYALYRIRLSEDGRLVAKESVDLRDVLEADDVIGPFFSIPGKENGIDIEGVAVRNGTLYVGFRGPVLRGNFVPVLAFKFEAPDDYELKFVQLGGRGIRDLVAVDDGFLILAGAVGDGDATYKLYLWNGEDCVPGENKRSGNIHEIGEVALGDGAKPEGITVAAETPNEWRLLLISDGNKNASKLIVPKPRPLDD